MTDPKSSDPSALSRLEEIEARAYSLASTKQTTLPDADFEWLCHQLREAMKDGETAAAARRLWQARELFRTADLDDRDYDARSAELTNAECAFADLLSGGEA